jgi:hypothetical protein
VVCDCSYMAVQAGSSATVKLEHARSRHTGEALCGVRSGRRCALREGVPADLASVRGYFTFATLSLLITEHTDFDVVASGGNLRATSCTPASARNLSGDLCSGNCVWSVQAAIECSGECAVHWRNCRARQCGFNLKTAWRVRANSTRICTFGNGLTVGGQFP